LHDGTRFADNVNYGNVAALSRVKTTFPKDFFLRRARLDREAGEEKTERERPKEDFAWFPSYA
jgi:hypothetical protein